VQLRRPEEHRVDVLAADHPAPFVVERMRGRDMVPIEGGTQALKRTINAVLDIRPEGPTTISVPRPFAETEHLAGSDRRRIRTLVERLPDNHPAWLPLDRAMRTNAQAALRILGAA
jgi:DNA primase